MNPIPLPTDVNLPSGADMLPKIISAGIQILFVTVVILSFVFLLLGGISWITAGGNKESLEKAQKRVTYSIVGLIIALLSFAVLGFIQAIFKVKFF